MIRLLTITLLLFSISSASANVAMPGFFQAGGNQEFELFYPEDSIYLDKLQMKEELILIDLHKGFAVVKGEYQMYNHSDAGINVHMGYPVSSIYHERKRYDRPGEYYEIDFELMKELKVMVAGTEVENRPVSFREPDAAYDSDAEDLWYVWEADFEAKATTVITVYFVVNTNYSIFRAGYDRAYDNGFIYLLESGKPWAGTIEKGKVGIRLMDDMKLKNVYGILPDAFSGFAESAQLLYTFTDLEPGHDDNIRVRYGKKVEDFNFDAIVKQAADLYSEVDQNNAASLDPGSGQVFEGKDIFQVKGSGGFFVGALMFLAVFGLPLLLISAVVIGVVWFVRRRKKKANMNL